MGSRCRQAIKLTRIFVIKHLNEDYIWNGGYYGTHIYHGRAVFVDTRALYI